MGTQHQFTVGRLLKKIKKLKQQGKISNDSKVVCGDNCGLECGKVESINEFGNELNFGFRISEEE